MSVDAEDFGEYFIACRDRKCVYEGEFIVIPIQVSSLANTHLPQFAYSGHMTRRACPQSDSIVHKGDRKVCVAVSRLLIVIWKRTENDITDAKKIEMRSPPGDSTFVKLLRLDAAGRPGLPEEEFFQLFTMCRQCHWIMTRSTFHNHKCLTPRIVIDLTSDSDD